MLKCCNKRWNVFLPARTAMHKSSTGDGVLQLNGHIPNAAIVDSVKVAYDSELHDNSILLSGEFVQYAW